MAIQWKPVVKDVANIIPARTEGDWSEQETFNEETKPTALRVQEMIDESSEEHYSAFGDSDDLCGDAGLVKRAKKVIALDVAAQVERGYFPEQVNGQLSAYDEIREEYKEKIEGLTDDIARKCGTGEGVGDPDAASSIQPSYDFATETVPLGRGFVW